MANCHAAVIWRKEMTYVQFNFLAFLLITFCVFYICPVKFRWIVLLGASLIFYGIAGVQYLPFIFVTSFSVWLAGKKMGAIYEELERESSDASLDRKAKKALKEKAKARCRKILIALLVVNIAILCYSKFTKFLIEPINSILEAISGERSFTAEMIIVPLGISYYTFSSLSYLMEVYWKRVDYEKNYFRFLLYACYFPHILQGPIARYARLGQRLKQELRFDYQRVCFGMQLMIWGFFKKLVIANRVDMFVTDMYTRYAEMRGFAFIVAALFDVVYIYSDFSGAMDIARGASQIFGVELDLNFDHPFASRTVPELWRRWHMSMGGWFREYVYMPISSSKIVKKISRNTKGKMPDMFSRVLVTLLPVTVTWVLTGLWHGTGKTYVAWGLYYAFIILMSVCFGDDLHNLAIRMKVNTESYAWKMFQMTRTTLIFAGGRLLTRPDGLWKTKIIVKSILTDFNPWVLFDGTLFNYSFTVKDMNLIVICLGLFALISHFQMQGSVREWIAKQGIVFRFGLTILALLAVIVFGIYGPGYNAASFAYMAY